MHWHAGFWARRLEVLSRIIRVRMRRVNAKGNAFARFPSRCES
ncbi:hypothetical protein D779_1433 [Imhoffiella purpurea]|uniref:Uncharacterized protein n=1 Tax=Imhoffiella purpurea TaxID=1249627 RepID=W9VH35_9GAMM|nr:hypothetical protein D779_1433 [Imhoffiella purpurea]